MTIQSMRGKRLSVVVTTLVSWVLSLIATGQEPTPGFNNQIPIALTVIAIGALVLGKTRWGYETFATGGNEQAAIYAGIPTGWIRIRAYLLSSLCATIAGLMAVAQDKGATSQGGLGAELIVIASVIIGGASILSSTTRADGFVVVPADSEGYPPGAEVEVFLYD